MVAFLVFGQATAIPDIVIKLGPGTTTATGSLVFTPDNTYDIGASGANRPRNVFIAGYSLTSGVIYAGSSLAFGSGATSVINGSGTNGRIVISNAAGNDFGLLQFGGTTSSFPALKRFGNAVAARAADDTVPTFATLTACSSAGEGAISPVSDSSTATWGATVTGGGANHVLAYCNGTNWTVAAK